MGEARERKHPEEDGMFSEPWCSMILMTKKKQKTTRINKS